MPNVYKLDGSTNIKMGTFCGEPALFIRPMFPLDKVNHSHEERHASHMNDLAENEQVIVMDNGQDLGQLYMAMRQVSASVHRGEEFVSHVHSGSKEQAKTKSADSLEWSWCSEPGIQVAQREHKHGDERISHTSSELIDGLLHITETNVRVEDPNLGHGCSTSTTVIDPPPEVAKKIFQRCNLAMLLEPDPDIKNQALQIAEEEKISYFEALRRLTPKEDVVPVGERITKPTEPDPAFQESMGIAATQFRSVNKGWTDLHVPADSTLPLDHPESNEE